MLRGIDQQRPVTEEMSPGVQSRDHTRLAADMTSATGHHRQMLDGIVAVRAADLIASPDRD
jgi:hypothetical protein